MASREFNPWSLFLQLESDLRQSAGEAFRSVMIQPGVDMYETEAALVVKMEMAGVRADSLNLTLSGDDRTLLVAGERVERAEERSGRIRCYRLEIYYGAFEREVSLPSDVLVDRENVKATYKDGMLVITLPKRQAEPPSKRVIPVVEGK